MDVIASVVLAMIAAAPGIWAIIVQRRKDRVDIAQKYEDLATDQLERISKAEKRLRTLEAQVKWMQVQIDDRDRFIGELLHGIHRLTGQLRSHDLVPVWTPPERKPAEPFADEVNSAE